MIVYAWQYVGWTFSSVFFRKIFKKKTTAGVRILKTHGIYGRGGTEADTKKNKNNRNGAFFGKTYNRGYGTDYAVYYRRDGKSFLCAHVSSFMGFSRGCMFES